MVTFEVAISLFWSTRLVKNSPELVFSNLSTLRQLKVPDPTRRLITPCGPEMRWVLAFQAG